MPVSIQCRYLAGSSKASTATSSADVAATPGDKSANRGGAAQADASSTSSLIPGKDMAVPQRAQDPDVEESSQVDGEFDPRPMSVQNYDMFALFLEGELRDLQRELIGD